jgi:hypothetical protein
MQSSAPRSSLLAAGIFALAGLGICSVRADDAKGKQPSESLAAKSSSISTNLPAAKPNQNGLKQLEQDLFKPFETIAPKGSLDGGYVLQQSPESSAPPPAIQNKRLKDLMERRRDWVFESPEEILDTATTHDAMNARENGKESSENSKLSPLERFYERLYNKDTKESTRKGSKRDEYFNSLKPANLSNDAEGDDDSDLPLSIRETQREMRKLLAPKERNGNSADNPDRIGFSDVFGLGKNSQSRQDVEMQRERLDRYKELVGLPVAPRLETDPLKQYRDMIGVSPRTSGLQPTKDSLGTFGGLPQQSLFGVSGAAFSPIRGLLPDGAEVHTDTSLAPVLPKIEPPKSLPPSPTFSAPRRVF